MQRTVSSAGGGIRKTKQNRGTSHRFADFRDSPRRRNVIQQSADRTRSGDNRDVRIHPARIGRRQHYDRIFYDRFRNHSRQSSMCSLRKLLELQQLTVVAQKLNMLLKNPFGLDIRNHEFRRNCHSNARVAQQQCPTDFRQRGLPRIRHQKRHLDQILGHIDLSFDIKAQVPLSRRYPDTKSLLFAGRNNVPPQRTTVAKRHRLDIALATKTQQQNRICQRFRNLDIPIRDTPVLSNFAITVNG